jgi:hypothetical protein
VAGVAGLVGNVSKVGLTDANIHTSYMGLATPPHCTWGSPRWRWAATEAPAGLQYELRKPTAMWLLWFLRDGWCQSLSAWAMCKPLNLSAGGCLAYNRPFLECHHFTVLVSQAAPCKLMRREEEWEKARTDVLRGG